MRVCEKCHGNFGCPVEHLHTPMGLGDPCGVCSGRYTEFQCDSPIAQEIASYNNAVKHFTLRMRIKFLENLKDKGGWQDIGYGYAIKRLNHEVGELAEALLPPVKASSDLQAIVNESADVANFAVFIGHRASSEDFRSLAIQNHTEEVLKRLEGVKAEVNRK